MDTLNFLDLFQGIATLAASEPKIMMGRIFLMLLGFLLIYLGSRNVLEPLLMIPMVLGMSSVNAGVMFIENGKITQIHGKSHQVGKRLIVTMYHPAAALHQPALRPALIEDFSKLRHLLGKESSVVQPKVEALVQPKWEASVPETKSAKKEEKTNLPEQLSLF